MKKYLLISGLGFSILYRPVFSCSIARWLKNLIAEDGMDISIFKAHSIKGAVALLLQELTSQLNWMWQTGHQREPSNGVTAENLKEMIRLASAPQFCHLNELQTIHVDMNSVF